MLVRYSLSSSVRPSVCPSKVWVLRKRLNVAPRKQRSRWPRDCYDAKDLHKIPTESHPKGRQNSDGVGKIAFFRPVEKSPAHTPYRRKFLFIRHGGPCPRRCAGGGIRGVTNNIGCSRSLLIILTAYLTTTLVVIEFCRSHYSRHACDTEHPLSIAESITTMCAQSYAGSRI